MSLFCKPVSVGNDAVFGSIADILCPKTKAALVKLDAYIDVVPLDCYYFHLLRRKCIFRGKGFYVRVPTDKIIDMIISRYNVGCVALAR